MKTESMRKKKISENICSLIFKKRHVIKKNKKL